MRSLRSGSLCVGPAAAARPRRRWICEIAPSYQCGMPAMCANMCALRVLGLLLPNWLKAWEPVGDQVYLLCSVCVLVAKNTRRKTQIVAKRSAFIPVFFPNAWAPAQPVISSS